MYLKFIPLLFFLHSSFSHDFFEPDGRLHDERYFDIASDEKDCVVDFDVKKAIKDGLTKTIKEVSKLKEKRKRKLEELEKTKKRIVAISTDEIKKWEKRVFDLEEHISDVNYLVEGLTNEIKRLKSKSEKQKGKTDETKNNEEELEGEFIYSKEYISHEERRLNEAKNYLTKLINVQKNIPIRKELIEKEKKLEKEARGLCTNIRMTSRSITSFMKLKARLQAQYRSRSRSRFRYRSKLV